MTALVELYSTLCYVEGDLSHVPKPGIYSRYIDDHYYKIEFDIILSFGLTELKAFIAWKENVRGLYFPLFHERQLIF